MSDAGRRTDRWKDVRTDIRTSSPKLMNHLCRPWPDGSIKRKRADVIIDPLGRIINIGQFELVFYMFVLFFEILKVGTDGQSIRSA